MVMLTNTHCCFYHFSSTPEYVDGGYYHESLCFLFDYERVEIIEVHFEDVFDDKWYKMMGYIDFNQDYTPCRDF